MRQRETVSVYAKGCPPVFKTDRLISVSSRFLLPMGGKVLLSPLVPSSPLTSPILLLQLFGPRNNGESWHHDCKMFQFSFQQAFTSFFVWCSVCVCIWFWMFSAIKLDISFFFFFNFVQHFLQISVSLKTIFAHCRIFYRCFVEVIVYWSLHSLADSSERGAVCWSRRKVFIAPLRRQAISFQFEWGVCLCVHVCLLMKLCACMCGSARLNRPCKRFC